MQLHGHAAWIQGKIWQDYAVERLKSVAASTQLGWHRLAVAVLPVLYSVWYLSADKQAQTATCARFELGHDTQHACKPCAAGAGLHLKWVATCAGNEPSSHHPYWHSHPGI